MIYINDSGFMSNNATLVKEKKKAFMGIWECHDLGKLKEFLGITIRCSDHKIILDQKAYLTKVLDHFSMTNAVTANMPLPHRYTPVAHTSNPDPTLWTQYQAITGSLLYLMLGTCPDIAFAVIKLSQFSANPSKEHTMNGLSTYAVIWQVSKTIQWCLMATLMKALLRILIAIGPLILTITAQSQATSLS